MRSKWQAALTGAAIIVGLSAGVRAQQGPRELFERAKLLEQSGRQSARVVEMYEEVATTADRRLAAAARLQIALLKEREGKPEARALYAAIVRDYPDQREVVSKAQTKLAARSAGGAGRSDVVPRRVLDGGWASILDISANGNLAVGWERAGYSARNILVRDMETGKETVLVAGSPSGSAGQARISPDGRKVAYNWVDRDETSAVTRSSLRIMSVDGGASQEVLATGPETTVRPSGWSPDGKRLLVNVNVYGKGETRDAKSSEVSWLTLDDRSMQVLKSFPLWQDRYPERLSPDGRFIAYAATASEGSTDSYLYVLDSQTLREVAVVTAAGRKGAPVWTVDGTHLLYEEATALKSVEVHDGQAAGEPRVVQSAFSGRPLAMTVAGAFYYQQYSGGGNFEFITSRAPSPSERPLVFSGLSGSWSRDGRSVAFVRGTSNFDLDLVVRDLTSGQERSYPHAGISVESPHWMPDGRALVVIVNERVDGKQRPSFYRVDLASGNFQRLFAVSADGRARSAVGALSADGKTMYVGSSASESAPVSGIVALDLATGEDRPVVSFAPVERGTDFAVAVSPDGNRLAVAVRVKAFSTARIFTVGTDGSNYRDVTGPYETGWLSDQLRWTSDGRALVFTASDARKNWRIMRVPAEGGVAEPDSVSYDVISSLLPSFRLWQGNFNNIDLSPDGSRIMTSALTSATFEIWTLDGLMNALDRH